MKIIYSLPNLHKTFPLNEQLSQKIFKTFSPSSNPKTEKFSQQKFKTLRQSTRKKLMRSLCQSQKLLSTRLAQPKASSTMKRSKRILDLQNSAWKENKKTPRDRVATGIMASKITDYFNSFFFQDQKERMNRAKSKRPQTTTQAIHNFLKLTKNGPMVYRKVYKKKHAYAG